MPLYFVQSFHVFATTPTSTSAPWTETRRPWKRVTLERKVKLIASHQLNSVGGSEGKRESVYISPGQREVQVIFCTDIPSQNAPPLRGAGLVQVRERFCHPLPQRTLQADHSVQEDQPPFTERQKWEGRKQGERFLLIAYYVQATVPGVVSCASRDEKIIQSPTGYPVVRWQGCHVIYPLIYCLKKGGPRDCALQGNDEKEELISTSL